MSDPRIQRTHAHVLDTARRMLSEGTSAPLTLSSLAVEARVSRRTLYTHWGSVEKVISEAVTEYHAGDELNPEGMTVRERLQAFLEGVRDGIHEKITHAALASLIHQSTFDNDASSTLLEMTNGRMHDYSKFVGPVTQEQYAALIGPIFVSEFFFRQPASDAQIEAIVDNAMTVLAYADVSVRG